MPLFDRKWLENVTKLLYRNNQGEPVSGSLGPTLCGPIQFACERHVENSGLRQALRSDLATTLMAFRNNYRNTDDGIPDIKYYTESRCASALKERETPTHGEKHTEYQAKEHHDRIIHIRLSRPGRHLHR